MYDKLDDGTMFAGPRESKWVCMNCGYIHEGETAPEVCPVCKVGAEKFEEMKQDLLFILSEDAEPKK